MKSLHNTPMETHQVYFQQFLIHEYFELKVSLLIIFRNIGANIKKMLTKFIKISHIYLVSYLIKIFFKLKNSLRHDDFQKRTRII